MKSATEPFSAITASSMKLRHTLFTSFSGLKSHPLRSLLTVLGIVIGVASIILVVAVGRTARELILSQVQGLGSRTLIVVPGKDRGDPFGFSALFADSLKERDLKAIRNKRNVPTLLDSAPIVIVPGVLSYKGNIFQSRIVGTEVAFQVILDTYPTLGRFFFEEEVEDKASVAVLGHRVALNVFEYVDPLGEQIKIKGRNFRVIGVFPEKGRVGLFDIDDIVLIPYTTAMEYLSAQDHYNEIIVRAESETLVDRTVEDITLTLRELRGTSSPDDDDFHLHTQADIAERLSSITSILTIFLASIAAISLVVGGIGIMNIMLVSVTERTREIGLRKALGATGGDILRQFLFEAIILTGSGGVIGVALGAALSFAASLILRAETGLGWGFTFPVSAAALAILISVLVGLIFGLYPASRAAKKSPIEALRYE